MQVTKKMSVKVIFTFEAATHIRMDINIGYRSGLNSAKEMFDLVLFAHPEAIQFIPEDCALLR